MAEKTCEEKDEGTKEKPFDAFIPLIDLMNSGTLTGNEMFIYLINGYSIRMKMNMMKAEILSNPLMGLMGLMGDI